MSTKKTITLTEYCLSLTPNEASPGSSEPDLFDDQYLSQVWQNLRQTWFAERADLDTYLVQWSRRRQKRTLASCLLEKRKVIVAREFNYLHMQAWHAPLLYHELCHAVLGNEVSSNDRQQRQWHGPEFKRLENRHPLIPHFNQWVRNGGWQTAIRRDRAKRAHLARKHS